MSFILQKMAPAKINLTLDVLGRRTDGYHQVAMVMQTIDLCDTLRVRRRDDKRIFLHGGNDEAPPDQSNLVYRTVQLIAETKGLKSGLDIYLEKKIPVAAGLAGGSSDAAAMMKLLNQLWEMQLSPQDMERELAKLGSDIPFLVQGGTALATGRGEQLQPLPAAPPFWVLLIKPPFGVSTPKVYQALQAPLWQGEPESDQQLALTANTVTIIEALQKNSYEAMIAALGNDLEQVTLQWHPELKEYKQILLDAGVDQAMMSGSGPTIMGFVQKEEKARAIADAVATLFEKKGCQVYVARSLNKEE
ncbi:4-(cytidine 5'-diphospho)-2-C-methyl-D-erythritol kinase [Heliorestis convoluta]|uniref:4-diphosphocytidyl-2-C-methyl-D-erythritol kinase n=1 Tax=Heliorestis convoluta TaxID=356322 RepID=A0A5Q2N327_9FIRM|nr:4-(cytidine 5'-diphospho)-2-C-methyl-D-erythritol kinase [Heliorestis convoluta]QGG48691.1 4-(cytidine 5'-diphospho)-2-C-methyl-D-erythritol kinase [Heliorestis convoluta]